MRIIVIAILCLCFCCFKKTIVIAKYDIEEETGTHIILHIWYSGEVPEAKHIGIVIYGDDTDIYVLLAGTSVYKRIP